jgi:hypothetical protein
MATGIGTPIGSQLAGALCAQARFTPEVPPSPAPTPQPAPAPTPQTQPSIPTVSPSSTATAAITAAQLKALLLAQLTPSGKTAKTASLLKTGGYSLTFKAPEAGTLTIAWYELPPGAKLAKKATPKPILIATGQVKFAATGTKKLELKLTAAGKALLKRSKLVKLTAKGTLTPSGKSPVSATKPFTLKR